MFKCQSPTEPPANLRIRLGAWELVLQWSLDVGVWCFVSLRVILTHFCSISVPIVAGVSACFTSFHLVSAIREKIACWLRLPGCRRSADSLFAEALAEASLVRPEILRHSAFRMVPARKDHHFRNALALASMNLIF